MKTKSICVIETIDADPPSIHTFTADTTGREQAKDCFRQIATEQDGYFDSDDIETALTSGNGLNNEEGSWTLQIIESEWRPGQPIINQALVDAAREAQALNDSDSV